MAADYGDAGFTVVMDDVVREADMEQFLPHLGGRNVAKVALIPRLEIALERNRLRRNKTFNPSLLEPHTRRLHRILTDGCRAEDGWQVVDTSELDADATATALLGSEGEAKRRSSH